MAARTDSLTGLLNHGAIQMRTSEEIWRSQRAERPFACLLCDLDNFKPINDRHGHLIGDEILKRVATALSEEFRPYDGIARYGGDEFVVILPDSDEADALAAADRLRACVDRAAVNFKDLGMPVSVSVGVAQWTEPQTAGELLDRADRALLLAKRRGKGSVVVASARAELELAEMEGGQAPSEFMNEFWDTVAACEEPREVLFVLPAFLRPPARAGGGGALRLAARLGRRRPRAALARPPAGRPRRHGVRVGCTARGRRGDAPRGSRIDLARVARRAQVRARVSSPRCCRRLRAAPTPRWAWPAPARVTACCSCVTRLRCSR